MRAHRGAHRRPARGGPRCPTACAERALAAFGVLADAEGRLHRRRPSQVHFHEVGGLDAIVDVVGTCAALEVLDVDEVLVQPGRQRPRAWSAPRTAPARTRRRPWSSCCAVPRPAASTCPIELTTPTGAALLAAWSALGAAAGHDHRGHRVRGRHPGDRRPSEPHPGGGRRRPGRQATAPVPGQPVVLLEANVDDVTGEVLAHAIGALLEAGAHDAWITPIIMKKGRPGHTVSVLADPIAGRGSSPRCCPPRPARSACGASSSTAGRRRAASTRSRSTGCPCV